ncbi:glycoside hydrolase family 10 protein [Chitinophagaceae bacterium MMS25-I14]
MVRLPAIILFALLFCLDVAAQQAPKREFRAAWIATVANIDWPSRPGLPALQQQQEFIRRLDDLKSIGCNAVIVQIRPSSDAIYASPSEPWSHYLTGRQGQPPFPYYDPLKFMIEEAHKRQMEFHAWFNPFRALVDSKKNPNPANHVTHTHPDWIVSYGGKSYINPGIPEAREYVINIITDVVKRYDIDAVHLDDYFYPYRIAGLEFGDAYAYGKYGQGFSNKNDWRRNNVNIFVSVLNTNIKHIKPYVKLGISPFGVWRNASVSPEGSMTRAGQTNYDDLYADVVLWMKNGWIDYLLPQLYWEHAHKAAAFDVLLPWWEQHNYGRHIYYGLGVYRMIGAASGPWAGSKELLWQIRDIRHMSDAPGFSFYSASSFDKIPRTILDSLHAKYTASVAFPPRMKWIDSIPPAAPVVKAVAASDGTLLQWQVTNPQAETLHFAVYRFVNNETVNLDRADKIIALTDGKEFIDRTATEFSKCTYVITALDRTWNESKASNMVKVMEE